MQYGTPCAEALTCNFRPDFLAYAYCSPLIVCTLTIVPPDVCKSHHTSRRKHKEINQSRSSSKAAILKQIEEIDVAQTQKINTVEEYPAKRNTVVTFAPRHTNIPFNDDRDPSCLVNIEQDDEFILQENPDKLYSSSIHLLQSDTSKRLTDKFAQTFFKSMINLSNRRFVEVINTSVSHDDKSLVFYCCPDELLQEEENNG